MIEFKINYIEFKNVPKPNIQAILSFNDKQYEILNDVINSGVATSAYEKNHILQSLDSIILGKEQSLLSGTERVRLDISKERTILTDDFEDAFDDMSDITEILMDPIVVPTSDLRDLIVWWIQEKPRLEKIANESGLSVDELNAKADGI